MLGLPDRIRRPSTNARCRLRKLARLSGPSDFEAGAWVKVEVEQAFAIDSAFSSKSILQASSSTVVIYPSGGVTKQIFRDTIYNILYNAQQRKLRVEVTIFR
jgi:hypothetical protein